MSNTQSKGISYISNSKRPYPEWLKNHTVFKEMSRIDKVFPRIGLPNFKEPCDIMNSAEAMTEATKLSNKLVRQMIDACAVLYGTLDTALASTEKDRNEKCAKIQYTINMLNTIIRSLQTNEHIKVEDGRVVMKLRSDIFCGDKNPIFRKNEAVLRICNKIWEIVAEAGYDKMAKVDQLLEFKDFSRVNVPNKKYTVAFSSCGEDGAWDIGTVSMRGVTSCQSWNAPQSRGLIGSISSKFVGVIYLASDQEVPGYGSKMLNRCMCRFAINKTTRKPALILDNMYPNMNADTLAAFKRVLNQKSGLEVLYTHDDRNNLANYYIPDEPSRKYLRQGEFSYMDYQVSVQTHNPSIKRNDPVSLAKFTDLFKKNVGDDLDKMVATKKELYLAAEKRLEGLIKEYEDAKAKWEAENATKPEGERTPFGIEKPRMDPELAAFARGGILNLIKHCDKKYGAGHAASVFAKLILDSVEIDFQCTDPKDHHRKYLMAFLKNSASIKEKAKEKSKTGTWIKSFPKSADRFFEMIFFQMRGYFLASCRELIKQSN